jgi:hypothetical protein
MIMFTSTHYDKMRGLREELTSWMDKAIIRQGRIVELIKEWNELVDKHNELIRRYNELKQNRNPAPAALDQTTVRRMLQLCHPDKHDNSPASVEITQLLLKMRK